LKPSSPDDTCWITRSVARAKRLGGRRSSSTALMFASMPSAGFDGHSSGGQHHGEPALFRRHHPLNCASCPPGHASIASMQLNASSSATRLSADPGGITPQSGDSHSLSGHREKTSPRITGEG